MMMAFGMKRLQREVGETGLSRDFAHTRLVLVRPAVIQSSVLSLTFIAVQSLFDAICLFVFNPRGAGSSTYAITGSRSKNLPNSSTNHG